MFGGVIVKAVGWQLSVRGFNACFSHSIVLIQCMFDQL